MILTCPRKHVNGSYRKPQNLAFKGTICNGEGRTQMGTAFEITQEFWILLDRIRQYGTVDKAAGGGGNGDVIGALRRW